MTLMGILWLVSAVVTVLALAGQWVVPEQALLVFLLVYAIGGTGMVK